MRELGCGDANEMRGPVPVEEEADEDVAEDVLSCPQLQLQTLGATATHQHQHQHHTQTDRHRQTQTDTNMVNINDKPHLSSHRHFPRVSEVGGFQPILANVCFVELLASFLVKFHT